MPGPRLVALAAALAITALVPGCNKPPRRTGSPDSAAAASPRFAGPRLPAPHKLSATPDAGAFVARPADVLHSIDAYVPQAPSLAAVAEFVIGTQAPAELAAKLAPLIAGDRPWAGVHVAGEDIILLPIGPGPATDALLNNDSNFPARGDFGAVELPTPALDLELRDRQPAAPRLAWLDTQTNNLVFAATLKGLATSRVLAASYGDRPIWFTLASARATAFMADFPYARVAAAGQHLNSLDVHVLEVPGTPLPTAKDLGPGALTGMLAVPELAVGVSTRWPGHKKAVASVIKQMTSSVNQAGFAAKLMLDPLVGQAARTLRRWNGRVLVGTGPARHVRIGLGADDPALAYRDLVGTLRALIDNLQLARMFANVPGASLKKIAGEPSTYLLTVDGVSRHVPAAAKPLLDDKGRLRVALAQGDRAGGLFIVIGPDPTPIMQKWVKAAANGRPAQTSTDDLLAGALAVSPEHLKPLITEVTPSQSSLVSAALKLDADRAPTVVVVHKQPDRYFTTIRGPEPEAPITRRGRGH